MTDEPERRPLTEAERKQHRHVVDGAYVRRSAERTRLANEREAGHTEIERRYYEDLSRVDAEYDNAIHEGLNALRSEGPGS